MGHWLAVRPVDAGRNRDAIGGWIEVRAGNATYTRELTVGGGHVSGQLVPWHFGLGSATRAEVRVLWPDGEQGAWLPVHADATWVVTRGATEATLIQ